MTSLALTSKVPNPNVFIHNDKVITTSLAVSESFEKRHDNVIQRIKNLECSSEFRLLNFKETSYLRENPNGGEGIVTKYYEMTKDGFIFLVMGFTGKKAAQFKEAYIAEFNRMEAQLLASQPSEPKRRGPYKNKKSDLPSGVYHCQSKYNPYRATAHVDGKFVHVGSFPTVDDAVAAIEHFYETGTVQRLHEIKAKPHINISNLVPKITNNTPNHTDLINHLKVFLEAAQLLSGYQYGKDLAWDLIAFTQEEASRHC